MNINKNFLKDFTEYKSFSSFEEKLSFIDEKMKKILKDLGYKIDFVKLKPKDPKEFIFFKKPNIIYLKENKIDDNVNYVKSLQYSLSIFQKEFNIFNNNKLIFIYLMEFPIHYLILFFIMLSQKIEIELYFSQEQIDKYNLKELEKNKIIKINQNLNSLKSIKIFNLKDAIKNNYLSFKLKNKILTN